MTVRTYCRRSKNDEGKQQFSLDVQLKGCEELIARLGFDDAPRTDYVDDGRAGDDFLTRAGLRQLLTDGSAATSSSAETNRASVATPSK